MRPYIPEIYNSNFSYTENNKKLNKNKSYALTEDVNPLLSS